MLAAARRGAALLTVAAAEGMAAAASDDPIGSGSETGGSQASAEPPQPSPQAMDPQATRNAVALAVSEISDDATVSDLIGSIADYVTNEELRSSLAGAATPLLALRKLRDHLLAIQDRGAQESSEADAVPRLDEQLRRRLAAALIAIEFSVYASLAYDRYDVLDTVLLSLPGDIRRAYERSCNCAD